MSTSVIAAKVPGGFVVECMRGVWRVSSRFDWACAGYGENMEEAIRSYLARRAWLDAEDEERKQLRDAAKAVSP
jgi:hypothetical protein